MEPFMKSIHLRFRHGDPAGLLFFGNVYEIAHDVYEDFVEHLGIEWKDWFQNPTWAVPIRHSSCEHLLPMQPSVKYKVRVEVDRLGKSSFTLKYVVVKGSRIYAEVSLVHTFFNKSTRTKMSIPSDVRERLEAYRGKSAKS